MFQGGVVGLKPEFYLLRVRKMTKMQVVHTGFGVINTSFNTHMHIKSG
jgi:hypothetical protein